MALSTRNNNKKSKKNQKKQKKKQTKNEKKTQRYMSRDGGVTWQQIREGRWAYEIVKLVIFVKLKDHHISISNR